MSACVVAVLSGRLCAQQIDLMAGGNTLWSAQSNSASLAFLPPPLKGGVYPSVSGQVQLKDRLGVSAEFAYRYHKANYNDVQPYRPLLYDINAVYAPRLGPKTAADFMAGIGGETLLFDNQVTVCPPNFSGCRTFINSSHFLVHLGGGVRYYFWHQFFARPEAHYYYVKNNFQFHTDNVFRVGVSVGYTFGRK